MGSVPVPISVTFLILLAVLALFGMWRGWVGRTRRSAVLVQDLPATPADFGAAATEPIKVTYVSSTTAGDWLDRVATHDLGARSAATIQVFSAGIAIERVGAESLFIPATHVTGAALTPGMAGKFVGRDGIVVVTWKPAGPDDPLALDTGLFPTHKADRDVLLAAFEALYQPPSGSEENPTDPHTSNNTSGSDSEPKERK